MIRGLDLETYEYIELLSYYAIKFQRLRVDRAHGIAPHKPILMLTIIQLIETESLCENRIYLNARVIKAFLTIWTFLGSEQHNPDISKPFFHLRGDKFWHHIPKKGFTKVINSKIKLKTFDEVYKAIKYAYLDDILFELLQDEITRNSLRTVLWRKWFSHKYKEYKRVLELNF